MNAQAAGGQAAGGRGAAGPHTVETARLRLVPIGPQAADELWRLHQDPGIARWYGGTWSQSYAAERADAMGRGWAEAGTDKWLGYDKVTSALVGRGGVAWRPVDGVPSFEVGWAVAERLWGRGLATEMGRAGLTHAFDCCGAQKVVAYTEVHNLASQAVMRRLGMRFDRQIRERGLIEGLDGVHDNAPFVLYSTRAQPATGDLTRTDSPVH